MKWFFSKTPALFLTVIVALIATPTASATATIVIQNDDSPNVGFNDPTPAAPIGGNSGTTEDSSASLHFNLQPTSGVRR
jgi:hypothetical protein